MKKILLICVGLFLLGRIASASCKEDSTFGADFYQARYNCEVILKGDAYDCHRTGQNMYVCSCEFSCSDNNSRSDEKFTRTIGVGEDQAVTNCEVILKGHAGRCSRGPNELVYCDCFYR